MRLPNLLATRRGRLAAFFALYVTEGIPLGFATIAIATQLRRQGVGPAEIGAFVGSFYLPWAFKWAMGPIVDVFSIERFGRRRGWILLTQLVMGLTLMLSAGITLPGQLGLFTAILLLHNIFAATQDVAIDALAVNTLHEDERGTANGMMFAGAYIGQGIGGAGVLFLNSYINFTSTFFFVAASIFVVTLLVVLPMKEAARVVQPRIADAGERLRAAGREMRDFAVDSFRSFLGTRGAFAGLLFALLPAGAMSLSLALQSNLAVEFGMNDDQIAWLSVWTVVLTAGFCVAGGWLSDRWGRRRMLFLYVAVMGLPVLYLMSVMSRYGWVLPVSMAEGKRPPVPAALLTAFWVASLVFAAIQGLMYGTRAAVFMDVTNPKVAATQFTAYMAMINLCTSYTSTWQGIAVEAFGYPKTLLVDALFGLACLLALPFMKRIDWRGRLAGQFADDGASRRARGVAVVLALACVLWVPFRAGWWSLGAAAPIAETLFTLVFIASALFLLAGIALLGGSLPKPMRIAAWTFAPLFLAMYARYGLGTSADAGGLRSLAHALLLVVPPCGAALLAVMASRNWSELQAPHESADAPTLARALP